MAFIAQTGLPSNTPDIVMVDIPCDSSVAIGDWVRMNGSQAVKAQADANANSHVIGLVEDKLTTTTCNIRVSGKSNVNFTGLDTSKDYFLSSVTAGDMDTTVPTGSGEIVLRVGRPIDTTIFVVMIGLRMRRA